MRISWLAFLAASAAALMTADLRAEETGPTYTDPSQADADFPFQGEYRGWQRSQPSHRSSEPYGLQVVALGDGQFSAVKYPGGLPGSGWFGGPRYLLSGRRVDEAVVLYGETYDVVLEGGIGRVLTKDGRIAGELHFVRRTSPTLGLPPPAGAIVLFDGNESPLLENPKISESGWLQVGTQTVGAYRNFRMHVEFLLPYQPFARGQGRANSGVYLQSRYEVQVLDSFGLAGLNNECGALYKTRAPDLNMCLPPLQWQTFDIEFRQPRFDPDGRKRTDARISVWHNGILVHNDVAIPNKTGSGQPEAAHPLPTKFQDHGNPVVFRNIWLVELDEEN